MTQLTAFGRGDLGVIACKHVAEGLRPVTLVTRYDDGNWSFSCGQGDHSVDEKDNQDYVLIHLDHVLDGNSSLEEVADLRNGWSAERATKSLPWHRYPDPA